MKFRDPWCAIDDLPASAKLKIEAEVADEIHSRHVLHGAKLEAIAYRDDQEEALFTIAGTEKIACVCLTWSGKVEEKDYPLTAIYSTLAEFSEVMRLQT